MTERLIKLGSLNNERLTWRDDGTPHFPFPQEPGRIQYQGRDVIEYLPAEFTDALVSRLSNLVELSKAANIIVPQNGAEWIFGRIAKIQGFDINSQNVIRVQTKRTPGGRSVEILNPEALSGVSREESNVVIEDLIDDYVTAGTLNSIVGGKVYALYAKVEFPNQPIRDEIKVAATIDKVWVGGNGADFGRVASEMYGYPEEYPRESEALLVMPESLDTGDRVY